MWTAGRPRSSELVFTQRRTRCVFLLPTFYLHITIYAVLLKGENYPQFHTQVPLELERWCLLRRAFILIFFFNITFAYIPAGPLSYQRPPFKVTDIGLGRL